MVNIFKSQFFKNSAWTIVDAISYPLIMVLATPFFINRLGAEQYGLWMLINVVVQVMNALNFGLGDSTIKDISRHHATHVYEQLNRSFNRNLSLSIVLLFCCLLLGIVTSKVIAYKGWFNIQQADMPKAMLTLVLFSCSAGLKFIEQVFLSVFKGLQRFDIAARLSMLSRLSVLASAVVVVYAGFDILMIVKVTLLLNLINLIIQAVVILKYTPVNSLMPRFAITSFNEVLQNNGWYWLQSVIALFGFLSDRIIIGQLSDLKTVGYYSIAALVGSQIHNVLLTFGSFVFPKVSVNNALNKGSSQIYFVSRFLINGLGWSVIIFLILFGSIIFRWWLGASVFNECQHYIRLYLAFEAVVLLVIVPYHFFNGSYYVKMNSLFEMVLKSMSIIGMYSFYIFLGVEGLLWALILVTIVNIPFQYFLFNRLILKEFRIREAFYPLLPALGIALLILSTSAWLNMVLLIYIVITFKWIYYNKIKDIVKNFMLKGNA